MEFGYSSSASSSPDPQAYTLPLIYDNTTDSSTPTSPDQLHQAYAYNSMPSYEVLQQYQANSQTFYPVDTPKIPVEFDQPSKLDEHDRRRKRTGNTAKEKGNTTNMHLRRRAQNRASQRAFRERKERHLKGLECQLDDLHEKHQDLLQSYTRQADEVVKLNARINELTGELDVLRSSSDAGVIEALVPDKFDAVPASAMLYSGPNFYFDKGVLDMEPSASQDNDLL